MLPISFAPLELNGLGCLIIYLLFPFVISYTKCLYVLYKLLVYVVYLSPTSCMSHCYVMHK
uniref:Uncharacterized protein n=1 Tax=Daphnia magna TaxID=35525 RepID=A0A0P5VGN0_9CRUS